MKIKEATDILKSMNDGYTFQGCAVCVEDNKYDEKDGICKSKTCEYLKAIETVLKELENSISKDKIREKAQEYDEIGMVGVSRAFEELLEESD